MGAVPTKILVVDDESQVCSVIGARLTARGFDYHACSDPQRAKELLAAQQFSVLSGEEALCLAVEMKPILILMDIRLPGMDGLEAARGLKADPRTKDIPIWTITAHARTEDRNKALAAGCDGYIAKPFERPELVRRLREFVASLAKVR